MAQREHPEGLIVAGWRHATVSDTWNVASDLMGVSQSAPVEDVVGRATKFDGTWLEL